jgi:hypothetical protein
LNPKKALEYYSRVYPSAWKYIDLFRADRGKKLPWWPDWCFCPLSGAYAIVSTEAEKQGIDITSSEGLPLINDIGIIGALAAWRVTQGVYRFDPDVYRAVIETPVTGDLPHDVLFNLPEWCIYIETPGLSFLGKPLYGFFAHLEHDSNSNRKELRFVMDHTGPDDARPKLLTQVLHLGPWSLLEAVKKAVQEARLQTRIITGTDTDLPEEMTDILQGEYMPLVSLLLYVCSVNGEIGDGERRPVRPRSKKTKKGQRIFPPQKITTWDVGVRMGAALRKAKQAQEQIEASETSAGQRTSPRAHVRRAHWHGYWTGPHDGERKHILKWLYPVLVGAGDDIPVTIRPVK